MNGASLTLGLLGAATMVASARGARARVVRESRQAYEQFGDSFELTVFAEPAMDALVSLVGGLWPDPGVFFDVERGDGEPEEDYDQRVLEAASEALYDSGVRPDETVAHLHHLHVPALDRSRGEGRRAVERAEAYARRKRIRVVMLVAAEIDEAAKHPASFWRHMGYAELPGFYEPFLSDRIFLKTLWDRR